MVDTRVINNYVNLVVMRKRRVEHRFDLSRFGNIHSHRIGFAGIADDVSVTGCYLIGYGSRLFE